MIKAIFTIFCSIACSQLVVHSKQPPILRVTSTLQDHNIGQPWQKSPPYNRRGLGIVIAENQILTTAEMVTNATFIRLQTIDGERTMPSQTVAIDYESNLALLTPKEQKDIDFIKQFKPVEICKSAKLNDPVSIVQVEDNGMPLFTSGVIKGADVVSSFADGHYFLTYEIKAAMQSASNSYTIPVLKNDKLVGILTSYDSKDQIIDCTAPEIISAFLTDAADGKYTGFPSLGINVNSTNDQHFRDWLKLSDEQGGIYIRKISRGGSADKAGLNIGDVILQMNGHPVSRRGYYLSENYGQLYWSHLINGLNKVGDTLELRILRDGEEIQKQVPLTRPAEGIIPSHTYGKAPRFLIKGGFLFQELTVSFTKLYGENWKTRAPINLLDAINHPEDYEQDRKRLVFLSRTLPTDATLGYERINSVIINKVNGKDIADIPSLIEAFKSPENNGIHTIELDDNIKKIYLDAELSDKVDISLLERGLPSLSRETE